MNLIKNRVISIIFSCVMHRHKCIYFYIRHQCFFSFCSYFQNWGAPPSTTAKESFSSRHLCWEKLFKMLGDTAGRWRIMVIIIKHICISTVINEARNSVLNQHISNNFFVIHLQWSQCLMTGRSWWRQSSWKSPAAVWI